MQKIHTQKQKQNYTLYICLCYHDKRKINNYSLRENIRVFGLMFMPWRADRI